MSVALDRMEAWTSSPSTSKRSVDGRFTGSGVAHRCGLASASDDDVAKVLTLAASVQRLIDAICVEAVAEVQRRSATAIVDERMTTRFGCHDVSELIQRTTLAVTAVGRAASAGRGRREGRDLAHFG